MISALTKFTSCWENKIYIGDDKGYVTQFNFEENEIILKQTTFHT